MNAGRKGGDGLGRGVDVGGLGVVIELDVVDGGDVLKAMLDSAEGLNGGADCGSRDAGQTRGDHSSQHVLDIVRALEGNLGERHDGFNGRIFGRSVDQVAGLDPRSLGYRVGV